MLALSSEGLMMISQPERNLVMGLLSLELQIYWDCFSVRSRVAGILET